MIDPQIELTAKTILNACIKIHKHLGPGLLESVYENCLAYELRKLGHHVQQQETVSILYEGINVGPAYKADLIIDGVLILELKSTHKLIPANTAQLLTYMRLGNFKIGFLLNFGQPLMMDGVKRYVL